MNDICVVMISCEERQDERDKTLKQFNDLNLNVNVFTNKCNLDDPASADKNMLNAIKALRFASTTGKHVLFVEDDIDIKPELINWLELLVKSNVYFADFCVAWRHCHPKAVMPFLKRDAMPPCVGVWVESEKFWGTQAVFFNKDAIKIILAQDDHFKVSGWAFDIYLRNLMLKLAWPVYACFPNPVQHRSPLSVVSATNPFKGIVMPRPDRHSFTYHLKPTKPISQAVWLKVKVKNGL